ncbi:YolD-like family protein [Paenibacillus glucanolyticus]|jgi:hypothetical protein|uniref:YolD-like family protein n=1 Tax=Paenibacillus glucanolyticus TaxID=59843 RepID=A0A163GVD7_9BACL|nr:YolD-like family protein [Paenibacillus glucanolyticus]KZS45175.1 hypothetical protein AWU65_04115 [Paenibacillus glucanolyticus]OMF62701.1 hypothetical protein BK142_32685 [Paenibacillus glucanolyticus]
MTRKLLDGNGLWESSRMMLPEHKYAINRKQHEEGRKNKPILDGQEIELIETALVESFHEHRSVTVQIFDEYQDVNFTGIVTVIHTYRREIKLSISSGEWEWIKIEDIISVS